ncbi:nitrogen regulation protein NR [Vibrio vulnificus]|nr:nitrogen regulation protein NR [Vibrio vulnificus]
MTLASPSHDATIRSNQGIITIQVQTNRKLDIGEQLQLVFDGNRYGAPQTSTLWQLKNIDRGTHIIAIQAVRSGKLIASTSPISVHLHRTKIK